MGIGLPALLERVHRALSFLKDRYRPGAASVFGTLRSLRRFPDVPRGREIEDHTNRFCERTLHIS